MNKAIIRDTIIFDGQVFQSTAWDRGMGKYSLNLIVALCKEGEFKNKNVRIVFAKRLNLPAEAKNVIKKLCPGIIMDFVDLKIPKVVPGEDIRPIQNYNKEILGNHVESIGAQQPDFVILSLLIDQYVSAFPENTRKILLFYDLIPLQYSERYGQSWSYPNYLRRFKTIFEADIILTISQTVADDLTVYTGIDTSRIKNIDGGAIDRSELKSKKPKIKLPEKFILMPSGNDLRKNNFRAVQGFEEFKDASGNKDMKLLITSYFDDGTRDRLLKLSDNIVFTGNVAEAELKWLYENTQALLFVSEYEGLGLPILEAAEVDKPIVCSNLTVFNEMSTQAFYYADQHNPSSIAKGIEDAIKKQGFIEKKKQYPELVKRYTWKNTADKMIDFISKHTADKYARKIKLAIFTPNPEGYSAIGKVVMLSHHALSQYFDIDYYVEDANSGNKFSRQSFLHAVANVYPSSSFNAIDYANYDAVIYHIGNSEYHFDSVKNALHLPGYLITHDIRLKELFEDELARYGVISTGRLEAEQELDRAQNSGKTTYMTSLVNASLGVVAHSHYAKSALKEIWVNDGERNISRLNLPVATPELKKNKIGKRFSLGFAGIIHRAKGLDIVTKIIESPEFHNIDLYIFGVPLVEPSVLEKLEAYPNVNIEKNLTDFNFEMRLSDMDAVVSYRPNYNGETSLTVIEALRQGVVPIVRKIGWFDELPDSVVEKVESQNEVLLVLKRLMNDENYLKHLQSAGKIYAKDNLSYLKYAIDLLGLINNTPDNSKNFKISQALKSKNSKDNIDKIIAEEE